MEAKTLFDFEATDEEELSFNKGQILKIIDMNRDNNWYWAELNGRQGYVPVNYLRMLSWYHDETSTSALEDLTYKLSGAFIVRRSRSQHGALALSVVDDGVLQHFRVHTSLSGKYSVWEKPFDTIYDLVEYYKSHSLLPDQQLFLRESDSDVEPELNRTTSSSRSLADAMSKFDIVEDDVFELSGDSTNTKR